MRTLITVPANSYNDFCFKISRMMIDVVTVKTGGPRYKIYDGSENLVATYDERKDHGIVYNYNNHSDLIGKVLTF